MSKRFFVVAVLLGSTSSSVAAVDTADCQKLLYSQSQVFRQRAGANSAFFNVLSAKGGNVSNLRAIAGSLTGWMLANGRFGDTWPGDVAGCIGYRADRGGTPEGAQCIAQFLGVGYAQSPACQGPGYAYTVVALTGSTKATPVVPGAVLDVRGAWEGRDSAGRTEVVTFAQNNEQLRGTWVLSANGRVLDEAPLEGSVDGHDVTFVINFGTGESRNELVLSADGTELSGRWSNTFGNSGAVSLRRPNTPRPVMSAAASAGGSPGSTPASSFTFTPDPSMPGTVVVKELGNGTLSGE